MKLAEVFLFESMMYVCVKAKILREADAMSNLNHPYIVELYSESVISICR